MTKITDGITTNEYLVKANRSFKWSAGAELFSKIIVLISNMVLAHLIAPSIFGIVASITIITSFAELFSEAGFSRFILQKKTNHNAEIKKYTGTANVVTITISILIFAIIAIFRNDFSALVNAEGYSTYLVIAALQIPLYGFSSIQTALARRNFNYSFIAVVRISATFLKLIVSITLAFTGDGIGALVYGSLIATFIQSIILIIYFRKSFSMHFSLTCFKEMLGVSSLFLTETFLSWLNTSIDVFLISFLFNQTTNGIYKNAFSTSTGLTSVVTAIYTSILISLLAKSQDNKQYFNNIICKYQRLISYFLVPFGVGIFLYRDFLTSLFFGPGWEAAALVLGIFSLIDGIGASTGLFVMNAFTATGKPVYNVIINIIGLCWILVSFIFGYFVGFFLFVIVRSMRNLVMSFFAAIFGKKVLHLKPSILIKNLFLPFLFCVPIIIISVAQQLLCNTQTGCCAGIFSCIIIYLTQFIYFAKDDLFNFLNLIRGKAISIE